MENINKIRNLIAEDQLEESLNELDTLTIEKNYELQNAIISLRRRLKDLKRGELSGALSYQDVTQEKAKINDALLGLLNELEGAPPPSKTAAPARTAPALGTARQAASPPAVAGSKKTVWMVVGGITMVIVLALFFIPPDSAPEDAGSESIEQGTETDASQGSGEAIPPGAQDEWIDQQNAAPEETQTDPAEGDTIWEEQHEQQPVDNQ